MKVTRFASLVLLVLAAAACSKKPGIRSGEEVSALIQKALRLGESTWPSAKVGGVKVGDEAQEVARSDDTVRAVNVYTVRVSFEFDDDPTDAMAKSGSVVCSPECRVIRHKVKRTPAASFPCAFDDALAAARKAGVSAKRPLVSYGFWNSEGRSGWAFRSDDDASVVEIGEGCAVKSTEP